MEEEYLHAAHEALKKGETLDARRWAEKAIALNGEREETWLILARCASPKASLVYLKRALELNPQSQRARQGMRWAVQRLRSSTANVNVITQEQGEPSNITYSAISKRGADTAQARRRSMLWKMPLLLFSLLIGVWFVYPPIAHVFGRTNHFVSNDVVLVFPTFTPTFTATFTPTFTLTPTPTPSTTSTLTPTFTPTLTPTYTPTYTPTFAPTIIPTATPTVTNTPTLPPTLTPLPTTTPFPTLPTLPVGVVANGIWMDVDLTHQRLTAYQGTTLMRQFIISSGAPQTQTKVGLFRVYAKNKSNNMASQEYDVPAVPYVLFYDKDFAMHGAYWHNDFGKPVSHGCINLRVEDARWLFEWASVGTLVNIHN